MGGQTVLRDIPERTHFGEVQFDFDVTFGEKLRFFRASAGGNFKVQNLLDEASEGKVLKKLHKHDKTDNVAGFYLEKIGLLGKRILRSKKKVRLRALVSEIWRNLRLSRKVKFSRRVHPSGAVTTLVGMPSWRP
ncbi:hypothetical protein [Desulfocicer niacini]